MFNFLKGSKSSQPGDQDAASTHEPKKSFYQRLVDSKRGEISEADVAKYTGMSKAQLKDWAQDRPGVAGNQAAGAITAGAPSGLGGQHAVDGFGGWGPGSNAAPKHPPSQIAKKASFEGSVA